MMVPTEPTPRQAAEKMFTSDWFSHNIPGWLHMFSSYGLGADAALTVVELGAYEGRASDWLLDNLLRHPQSVLHCVDTFPDPDAADSYWGRFRQNVLLRDDSAKVRVHSGSTFSFLVDFVQRHGRADFIYVDASHRAPDVLTDLVLAFRALKVGGLMICDDYLGGAGVGQELTLGSPKIAVDAFTTIFRPQIEIVAWQPLYQLAFVKREAWGDDDPGSRGAA